MWVWIVIFETKVFKLEIIDTFDFRIDTHLRELAWSSTELFFYLLKVIKINMNISEAMDKLPNFKTSYLSYHHEE